jgi:hypothetical protein
MNVLKIDEGWDYPFILKALNLNTMPSFRTCDNASQKNQYMFILVSLPSSSHQRQIHGLATMEVQKVNEYGEYSSLS